MNGVMNTYLPTPPALYIIHLQTALASTHTTPAATCWAWGAGRADRPWASPARPRGTRGVL